MDPTSLLFLIGCLVVISAPSGSPAPAEGQSFRSSTGVTLNSRSKAHGTGERCPTGLRYCVCRTRGAGIDITCEDINTDQLHADCNVIKKQEHLIRYFKIRKSNIPRLEDHTFMGMKIVHLYIHDCKLKSLGPNSVSSQGNTLSHLVLSKNLLTEVPTKALKFLKNLDHLNLNDNELTALRASAFVGLSKVTRLSLYNNKISHIEGQAFDGLKKDMVRLNLGKNSLQNVPKASLSGLAYLEMLELSENHITTIEPGDFNGMDNLDHLVLNHNQITHLGESFFTGLPKLTTLYIDHNGIRTIHKNTFKGLEERLESLTLTSNQIEEFPSLALRPIHKLTTLHIDDNKISRIDEDAFQGFGEHIKFLWLQNNMIKEIPPPAFQDLHSLEWIKLYNNVLTTLHYELMEPVLDTLVHIDIHSNPLVCDCELRWYRQWIEEEWNAVEEEWLKATFCEDPADNMRHNIAEVPLKDMFCNGEVRDKPSSNDDGGAGALFFDWMLLTVAILMPQLWTLKRSTT